MGSEGESEDEPAESEKAPAKIDKTRVREGCRHN